ncbi:MAG: DMT family transporter [Acidimicrobiia bacterium]
MIRDVARAFAGDGDLSERQGAALVAASGVVFSITAIVLRAVDEASDWQVLAYRGASTAAAMVLLVWLRRRGRPVRLRDTTWRTVLAGVVLATTSMLYVLALSRTSAATTLFLLAAAPIYAAMIGWLVLGERVPRTTRIAIGITAVGIVVMVGTGLDAGSGVGVLLAAIIPVTIGLYNVIMRADGGADPVVPALVAGVALALVTGTIALAVDGLAVSFRDGFLACLTGGVALGIGLPLFNLGHKSVAAAKVSLLLMTEVVLAPLWVWIWPGETPALGTLIGGAIVLATVAWLVTRAADEPDVVDETLLVT